MHIENRMSIAFLETENRRKLILCEKVQSKKEMCADSLPKINSSSLLVMSKGNIKSFNDSKHAKNAFNQFVQLYNDGTLTDFVLSSCDHKKFHVHSLILTASSQYLSNIFLNVENEYHLDFVESTVLEKIIKFCYTGEIDLSSNNIQAITSAASELAMQRLMKVCNQYLEQYNFLLYAIIAEKCGLKSSQELAHKYLMFSCNKLCETNDVTQLNTHRLNETVTNLCSNQAQIFGGLIQSLNNNGGESNSLLLNSYQAIYQLFFMAGYIQSLVNVPNIPTIQEKPPPLIRSGTVDIPKVVSMPPIESEANDEGLFFVAKNKLDGVDVYATIEMNGALRIMPKHHIFIEKMNLFCTNPQERG